VLYELPCPLCHEAVSADTDFAGQWVRCPHCQGQFQLSPPPDPPPPPSMETVPGPLPGAVPPLTSVPAGAQAPPPVPTPVPVLHRYRFTCPRCESVLEAHTGQTGGLGKCPTCATEFVVPSFDPKTGQVGEVVCVSGEAQDPTPVHAYAADGARAPEIVRTDADELFIRCPRCRHDSPVDADRCQDCGLPFTLEGVTHGPVPGGTNGYAVASLVMGLLGVPCLALIMPQVLAVVFGLVALNQIPRNEAQRGRGLAWAGILLGAFSLAVAAAVFLAGI